MGCNMDERIKEWITNELSGGVKTLMLMAFDQSGKVFNASACGNEDFEIEILNTGDIVHNMLEYVDIAGEYV